MSHLEFERVSNDGDQKILPAQRKSSARMSSLETISAQINSRAAIWFEIEFRSCSNSSEARCDIYYYLPVAANDRDDEQRLVFHDVNRQASSIIDN